MRELGVAAVLCGGLVLVGCSGGGGGDSTVCLWDNSVSGDLAGTGRCTDAHECPDGCSCLVMTCTTDQSLEESFTCTKDQQCMAGLKCAPALFQCHKPCSDFFTTQSACDAGAYCKPVITSDGELCSGTGSCTVGTCAQHPSGESHCRFFEGFCVDGDPCTVDSAGGAGTECKTAENCVKLSASANACLTSCQVTFASGYDDNCSAYSAGEKYCSPIGQAGSQHLICLDTFSGASQATDGCDLNNPCADGLACTRPVAADPDRCYAHCDHNDLTAANVFCANLDASRPLCCVIANAGDSNEPAGHDFGICLDQCP